MTERGQVSQRADSQRATAARHHRTRIQVRFGDTDALGHLNNAAFAAYAELGRLDFCAALGVEVSTLILASLAIDYRKQVRFGQTVHLDTWVERIGRSSVALRQHVYADGELSAEVASVIVNFDYAHGTARELSAEQRSRLAPYLPHQDT